MKCDENGNPIVPHTGFNVDTLKALMDEKFVGVEDKFVQEREATRVLVQSVKEQEEKDTQNIKDATAQALSSQKELTLQANIASQKAIDKSDAGQNAYNAKSNEFRQSLDDANKNNISRTEYVSGHKALSDKINLIEANSTKFVVKEVVDTNLERLRDDIKNLQLTNATLAGKADQSSVNRMTLISIIGIIFGLIGTILALINFLTKAFVK